MGRVRDTANRLLGGEGAMDGDQRASFVKVRIEKSRVKKEVWLNKSFYILLIVQLGGTSGGKEDEQGPVKEQSGSRQTRAQRRSQHSQKAAGPSGNTDPT